jgi:hypothetical protein
MVETNLPYNHENHVQIYDTVKTARGIIIIDTVPDINPDTGNSKTYVDVEK